jgi:formate-dependent phosphoribosylglycinamide formyltransferase (GAR transformylase)
VHVIFVEPAFPSNQREFVRALAGQGVQVTGIGERPVEHLDDALRSWLWGYEQVRSVTNTEELEQAVRRVQSQVWVDRMESTIEAHVLPAAVVRERCGIPGTTVRTAFLCRDKPEMKRVLREAGVPCAQSDAAQSVAEVRELIAAFGYPIIIKPRDAAGASGTWRVDDDEGLDVALRESGVMDGQSVAVEEFVDGHEGFYDTLTINGTIVHDFISHYYPNVLEAMRTRWISPQIVATNQMETPGYVEVRAMGKRVSEVLGIDTSATHMEWFFGSRGLKFSEIGCRPPGVGHWDVYNTANDFDLFTEWASAVVHGRSIKSPSRRYAAGIIALRPDQDGRISGYTGTKEVWERYGEHIVDDYFPERGQPTQGVEAGYMANAWMRVRHEDYDSLREILNDIGETVQVHAEG